MGGPSSGQVNANNLANTGAALEGNAFREFNDQNVRDTQQARQQSNTQHDQILAGYTSLLAGNGQGGSGGSGGGGGGGNGVPMSASGDPRFEESENSYRNFMNTGGWEPERVASIDSDIHGLQEIGRTGGVSDEGIGRIRGGGVFDEFANTGGYSAGDRQSIRSRATSVIPSLYGNMRDTATRSSLTQGGYGPGKSALMARLARGEQGGMADASLNAELGIMDKVNSGRQWGAGQMSGAELGLADLQSRNKINSLSQAGDVETGFMNSRNQGREFGTQGIQSLAENQRQADIQREGIRASSGANQQALDLQRQFGALGGLQSLYSSVPEEYMNYRQMDMQNRFGSANTQQGWANIMQQGRRPGIPWGQVLSTAGTVAGAAIAASSRELKENIKPLTLGARDKIKKLPLYTWNYKGDKTPHVGPMAEDFQSIMGVGDGKTLHLVDVMGSILAAEKEKVTREDSNA